MEESQYNHTCSCAATRILSRRRCGSLPMQQPLRCPLFDSRCNRRLKPPICLSNALNRGRWSRSRVNDADANQPLRRACHGSCGLRFKVGTQRICKSFRRAWPVRGRHALARAGAGRARHVGLNGVQTRAMLGGRASGCNGRGVTQGARLLSAVKGGRGIGARKSEGRRF